MAYCRRKGPAEVTRNVAKLKNAHYDLIIVGGGINGAAIANLAHLYGVQPVLFEKNDFASGTSSKSTKLIHGGLRYLENLEFDLVHEALCERDVQMKAAPHLVRPLRFIVPVYKEDKRPLWMMKLGVFLYDLLSGRNKIGRHKGLTSSEVHKSIPSIKTENLLGGVSYYDAQMDDARLCLENILSARDNGAHVYNYMEVVGFHKEMGRAVGVKVKDVLDGKMYDVYAKKIICCGGPWANELMSLEDPGTEERVRPTKGAHIVYDERFCDDAVLITSKEDDRIFFIIPWHGHSLIGTTDTDYKKSPDQVECNDDDIEYLFREAKKVFPSVNFSREKIITTFAGLRPLANQKGSPSKVSRRHVFHTSYLGITYVMGGKYTTYRRIAKECLDRLYGKASHADGFKLYGSAAARPAKELATDYGVSEETASYLCGVYGGRVEEVLRLIRENSQLKEPLCPALPAIMAQVNYGFRVELAQTIEDIIDRRLSLNFHSSDLAVIRSKILPILEENSGKKRG